MTNLHVIERARENCEAFCEYILRDEETGDPINLMDFQEEWHRRIKQHRKVVIWAFPDSGKTQNIAIGRILWLLGRNPRRRYAILSATATQATKVIRSIKEHIETNEYLHEVFPDLKPGSLWRDDMITVVRPDGIRDPSVQAYSPEGGSIQGARLDGLVIDDVLTLLNTWTAYQRDKIQTWIKASAFSRMSRNAWIAFLTNAWHPEDMAHELKKLGWWGKKYPVLTPSGRSLWPQHWPMDRIDEVRTEMLTEIEFARQMLCEPRDEATAIFKRSWVDTCLDIGQGYRTYQSLEDIHETDPELAEEIALNETVLRLTGGLPEGVHFVTGVDPAVSKKDSADETAIVTIMLWPDGLRQLVEIQAGRWHGPEILARVISAHERFRSVVVVENNAAQDYLLQFGRDLAPDLQIKAFTTGRNKLNPEYGIESLGVEFAVGKWLIPCIAGSRRVSKEVGKWISEILDYDPKKHVGDRLMASWFAREYARALELQRGRKSARRGGVTIVG